MHQARALRNVVKTIGVISDTHGLLRPTALEALADSDLIVHAGDVGGPEVLEALRRIAPVFAVRGNMDKAAWAQNLPRFETVEVEGCRLHVLHDLQQLDLNPAAAGVQVVISGHSHQPSITTQQDVLYLNPGSAGPRRFQLPITVARLVVRSGIPSAEILDLKVE